MKASWLIPTAALKAPASRPSGSSSRRAARRSAARRIVLGGRTPLPA